MRRRAGIEAAGGVLALATLERQVAVRLVDISRNGCMFESPCPLEAGTVGRLTVQVAAMGTYEDVVRVERSQAARGVGQVYQVGAQFMWTDGPGEWSLRRLGHELPAGAPRPTGIVELGRALEG